MKRTELNNRLIEHTKDFFEIVVKFHDLDWRKTMNVNELQSSVLMALTRFEQLTLSSDFSVEDIKTARYALAAFFDELVMSSVWNDRFSWMSKSLQWIYFGEHSAGEGFFKKLTEIKQYGQEKLELLELYYLCIQLGFQGVYRVQDHERLSVIASDVRHLIIRYRHINAAELTPEANRPIVFELHARKINDRLLAAIFLGVFVFIYSIFDLAIHHVASTTTDQLTQYQTKRV
jgi:type VI secretion system protein ImpK